VALTGRDVLVLRALGLGDSVTAVPALRGLRRAWPGHPITLAAPVATGTWLQRLGLVDGVLPARGLTPLPVGGSGEHLAVNLHGRGPLSHAVLGATTPDRLVAFACEAAGFRDGPAWDEAEHEVDRWCRLVRSAGGTCDRTDLRLPSTAGRGGHVVVHPGAAAPGRRWPADRFAAVVRHLCRRGCDVVLTGSADERSLCEEVARRAAVDAATGTGRVADGAGCLDLAALAHVVAGARLVVCGDTGVAHLATAFGTPSVLLFGPTSPDRWGPAIDPDRHVVLWHGTATGGDPHATRLDPALAQIGVDEVVDAADRLAGRVRPAS